MFLTSLLVTNGAIVVAPSFQISVFLVVTLITCSIWSKLD